MDKDNSHGGAQRNNVLVKILRVLVILALVDEEMGQCCREDDINVQAEFCKVWPSLKEELDPSYEDEDVESKVDGIAGEIKQEGLTNTLNQDQVIDLLREDRKSMKDFPWIILGDFNATLDPSKKSSGGSNVTTAINDFKECVADIDMKDITMSGLKFT
nr:RNA-directed DNA polymerase, eukaryota, reverse transcriptase zinc-binding domain protein [Tanacetum cinerariifolium]